MPSRFRLLKGVLTPRGHHLKSTKRTLYIGQWLGDVDWPLERLPVNAFHTSVMTVARISTALVISREFESSDLFFVHMLTLLIGNTKRHIHVHGSATKSCANITHMVGQRKRNETDMSMTSIWLIRPCTLANIALTSPNGRAIVSNTWRRLIIGNTFERRLPGSRASNRCHRRLHRLHRCRPQCRFPRRARHLQVPVPRHTSWMIRMKYLAILLKTRLMTTQSTMLLWSLPFRSTTILLLHSNTVARP